MRVVSLIPSATELLAASGAEDMIVGRSHECDYPASLARVPMLTRPRNHGHTSAQIDAEVTSSLSGGQSLYELDEALLAELAPDLIVTQNLCEVCSIDLRTVERLAALLPRRPTILSLDPKTIFDVFDDLLKVGAAVGRAESAEHAMVELRARYWTAVDFVNPYIPGPEVLFLEWCDPTFVGGHWIPGMIEAAGGRHSLNKLGAKSRRVSPEEILEAAPDRVIISPCGYDLSRTRTDFNAIQQTRWWPLLPAVLDAPPRSVALIDGNQMFSRPGPRLVDAFEWLVAWLNSRDELAPPGFPVEYPLAQLASP